MSAVVRHIPQEESTGSGQLMGLIQMAMSRDDFDADKLKELLAVKKEWEADEARKAYVAAMAAFKAESITIVKDKTVAFSGTRYTHASIGNVVEVITGALGKHGLSHRWDTKQENGLIRVSCIITHAKGHSESTSLEAKPDDSGKKNAIQQVASTVSYLQRYTLLAATGLATKDQEDDDAIGSERTEAEVAAEEEAAKIRQGWLDAIAGCTDETELAARKKELVKSCGGSDKVPQELIGACVARKAALAK